MCVFVCAWAGRFNIRTFVFVPLFNSIRATVLVCFKVCGNYIEHVCKVKRKNTKLHFLFLSVAFLFFTFNSYRRNIRWRRFLRTGDTYLTLRANKRMHYYYWSSKTHLRKKIWRFIFSAIDHILLFKLVTIFLYRVVKKSNVSRNNIQCYRIFCCCWSNNK